MRKSRNGRKSMQQIKIYNARNYIRTSIPNNDIPLLAVIKIILCESIAMSAIVELQKLCYHKLYETPPPVKMKFG